MEKKNWIRVTKKSSNELAKNAGFNAQMRKNLMYMIDEIKKNKFDGAYNVKCQCPEGCGSEWWSLIAVRKWSDDTMLKSHYEADRKLYVMCPNCIHTHEHVEDMSVPPGFGG